MKRHVILVGLPGSGKTTVGRLAASQLGTTALDVDEAIERAEGTSIAEIFASRGEFAFRDIERREAARALASPAAVIVPGGGWAAQPGNLETVGDNGITVYLETRPETAFRRVTVSTRPLLAGDDPRARLRALLAQREPYYRTCHHSIATDGKTPEEVARQVVELARRSAGW